MTRKFLEGNGTAMKRLTAVLIYAIAMGYLESAVVIYLRETAFGNSVQVFPLRFMTPQLGQIELIREAATIVMLLTTGYLAGKNTFQKWMFFVYSFAVWDIFYYIFLRIFTGWPHSFGDFDVLFLIPVIWISPVAAPILISLLLTLTSIILISLSGKSENLRISITGSVLFLSGAAAAFYSFAEQSIRILVLQGAKGLEGIAPVSFDWISFSIGFLLMCLAAIKIITDCFERINSDRRELNNTDE
ncbi:MAG: hypothetical protein ACLP05_01415 [Candidatus Kryptoniota bacterium]